MNELKERRIQGQRKVIVFVMLLCSLAILVAGILIKENDLKIVTLSIGAGLLVGAFIAKAFSGKFGYKPTREEIEEKIFGK